MKNIKYSIPGINCNHCIHTIKTELSELEGVSEISADLGLKEITIQYDDPATPESIEELLSEINFPVAKV